jgi:hypothetical protein
MRSAGPERATAPEFVSHKHAEWWPTQTLGSEESPVRAKDEGKWAKFDVKSMLNEETTPSSPPLRTNSSDAIVPSAGGKFPFVPFKNNELTRFRVDLGNCDI